MHSRHLLARLEQPKRRVLSDKSTIPAENFLQPRPWLALYGNRLKTRAAVEDEAALSPIQRLLPEEVMVHIFSYLPSYHLGVCQSVCKQWKDIGETPSLWKAACLEAFWNQSAHLNAVVVKSAFRGCWKDMFMERPHLRFDGIYVSRNTYIRQGQVEWRTVNAAHLVCFYRYFRFFPNGHFVYRTSPEPLAKVAKSLSRSSHRPDLVDCGRYKLEGDKLRTGLVYRNSMSTEVQMTMLLRSTTRGAMNRLDMQAITSYDRATASSTAIADLREPSWGEPEEGLEMRRHKKGMATLVFVPWDQVTDHAINLPVSKMDFFLPG